MTRPAGDAEARLLAAGKALLQESGLSGLSVRAVAARAGVNQGLVSYHFGGKEAFVKAVLQEVYEDFFQGFTLGMEGQADPVEALRSGLLSLARFVRDHRGLVRSLMKDLQAGNPVARAFVNANLPRHGRVLVGLLEAGKRARRLENLPIPLMMGTIMGVIGAPTLMADVMMNRTKTAWAKLDPEAVKACLLTDEALELRVKLALKALQS